MHDSHGRSDADRPRNERGAALVVVLILATALILLAGSMLGTSITDRTVAANDANSVKAFNLAEAGIEHAVAELPNRDADTLLAAGGTLFASQAMGEGSYSVSVANNVGAPFPVGTIGSDAGGPTDDTDNILVVSSTGNVGNTNRTLSLLVNMGGGPAKYTWAAFGRFRFKMSGGAQVVGPAGTNDDMQFSGSAPKIVGDAQAVGTISDPTNYVSGTAVESAPPVNFPVEACPAVAWGPAPTGDHTFDPANGKLTIGSGGATFAAGTYYFFSVKKSGGGGINVAAGDKVVLYISDLLSMSGGGFNNANNDSNMFEIIGCGPSSGGWTITGEQTSYFTIYAPNQKIKFTGGGDKYGSYVGIDFENTGPGRVVYDGQLASGGGGVFSALPGTWGEIW